MNYRHIYHAGNFADVIKHLLLIQIIEHLKQKEAAFFVLDTHAGTGMYDLHSTEALKTNEAVSGIGRILAASTPTSHPVIRKYINIIQHFNANSDCKTLSKYPGSPALIASLIRPQDRLLANELHPEDYASLRQVAAQFLTPIKTLHLDAYTALKANLPPKEQRGLVLIDPPFEDKEEFTSLALHLKQALKRWQHGTYMIWFPLKLHLPIAQFYEEISALSTSKTLLIEGWAHPAYTPNNFNGSGLIILNTPWQLDTVLKEYIPFLNTHLFTANAPGIKLRWLAP